jgi:hypothetical protein
MPLTNCLKLCLRLLSQIILFIVGTNINSQCDFGCLNEYGKEGNINKSAPVVKSNIGGDMVFCWSDYRDGINGFYIQLTNQQGIKKGPKIRVNDRHKEQTLLFSMAWVNSNYVCR